MANPLFSTYAQGENRITASILAVFERLSFALVEQILQGLFQEPETQLLTFRNQPSGLHTKPDAKIHASFSYWIETKRVPKSVRVDQIRGHLKALDEEKNVEIQRLLILTPDDTIPNEVTKIQDVRLSWANFDDLVAAIKDALDISEAWLISEQHIPTERERELLRELVAFLISEGLVGRSNQQVLIVAARLALSEYQELSAYLCQPNRSFRLCSHMTFYANGCIYRSIPKILDSVESVVLSEEGVAECTDNQETRSRLLGLIERLSQTNSKWRRGEVAKVLFLSAPDAPDTIQLPHDIRNNLVAATGKAIAFTQGQRYVPLNKLQAAPKTTAELLGVAVVSQ